jgi:AcrR family transcriptional regulator
LNHQTKIQNKSNRRGRPADPDKRLLNHTRLKESAYTLFAEEGIEAVSVARLADAGGQSKGSFYWYFKDKGDCIRQVLSHEGQKISDAIHAALKGAGPAKDRLYKVSDFRFWQQMGILKFVRLLNNITFCSDQRVRDLARLSARELNLQGCEMFRHLGLEVARESGWSERQLKEFDFFTWAMLYIGCYEGVYNMLYRKDFSSAPSNERIARAIHLAFVDPLVKQLTARPN